MAKGWVVGKDGQHNRNERAYALSFRCASSAASPSTHFGRGTAVDIGRGEGDGEGVGKGEDGCPERNERAYALSFRCASVPSSPCMLGKQHGGGL